MAFSILKLSDVIKKTKLSRSTIYNQVAQGEFPGPVKISTRASGWLDSEVDDWISEKVSMRDSVVSANDE